MRIGASVILKNGKAVQSYGWNMLRPLGSLQSVLQSLDEYECDEIAIVRYARGSEPNKMFSEDIEALKNCKTSSPISFGGGICDVNQLEETRQAPIERLIFSSMAIKGQFEIIEKASERYGHQAIQCLLPIKFEEGELKIYLSSESRFVDKKYIDFHKLREVSNELIIYDTSADGIPDRFSFEVMKYIDYPANRLVLTGGIGEESIKRALSEGVASVLIENRILHQEFAVNGFKKNALL